MTSLTKKMALKRLSEVIAQIDELRGGGNTSPEHVRWFLGTRKFIEDVFGRKSDYYINLNGLPWQHLGTMIMTTDEVFNPGSTARKYDMQAYVRDLDVARGILMAAQDELQASDLPEVYHGKDTPPETSAIVCILNLVERKLRKTIRAAPSNEKQVQEAIENMFISADIDYARETDSIEYSSKTYIPDFTIAKADLAIEVKLCAKSGREKAMAAEVNDDILAYSTKYGNILFIVYDCGFIRDVERFAGHFEESQGVMVRVIKH